jgi:cell cycle sensor histidine kinase DivJ
MMGDFRRVGCHRIIHAPDLRLATASLSVRLSELCHHPAGFGERVREVAWVGSMSVLASVRDYVHSLVHPSARCHAPTAARHYAFMAPRLIGGLSAVSGLPVYLALRGAPSAIEALALGWLITPILLVYDLSRTGQLERAHFLCSLSLTGLVTALAARTGGILSFAAIWFALVPLEAALSASRRTVLAACTMVFVAACFLAILGACDLLHSERAPEARRSVSAAGLQRVWLAPAQFEQGG